MVQVDIVWSYAFGATFAAAATRQLKAEPAAFNNTVYTRLLVFLGVFFAPSGLYLLWEFPSWETMQVATSKADIPSWLVVLFGVTNVTQGILGYWIGWRLSRSGDHDQAHLNWMLSWTLFWFVLVCGWDTSGWQRFLYDPALNQGEPWSPGRHNGLQFFTGPVFRSLFVMGALFMPMLRRGIFQPSYNLLVQKPGFSPGVRAYLRLVGLYLGTMFGLTLGMAIVAAMLVRWSVDLTGSMLSGYAFGVTAACGVGYFLAARPGGLLRRLASRLY